MKTVVTNLKCSTIDTEQVQTVYISLIQPLALTRVFNIGISYLDCQLILVP